MNLCRLMNSDLIIPIAPSKVGKHLSSSFKAEEDAVARKESCIEVLVPTDLMTRLRIDVFAKLIAEVK